MPLNPEYQALSSGAGTTRNPSALLTFHVCFLLWKSISQEAMLGGEAPRTRPSRFASPVFYTIAEYYSYIEIYYIKTILYMYQGN